MKIDIINKALIKLGEKTISSTQNHSLGAILDMAYEDIRRSLLSMYVWRFAIRRQNLAYVDEPTNTALYKYKYQRPNDCLMVVSVGDYYKCADLRDYNSSSNERYLLEGKYILSNDKSLNLVYVGDVKEDLPPLFEMAMACKIAGFLSVKIHQNPNLSQMYEQEANAYLMQAIQINEIMQDSQSLGDNSWISVRRVWEND